MRDIVETRITYSSGEVQGKGEILAVVPAGPGRWAIVTDSTPFHPVDYGWPDQPGDYGTLTVGAETVPVVDTEMLTMDTRTGEIRTGSAVTARRGDPDHVFAVAHIVEREPAGARPGQTASLEVNDRRRRWLSAAHTGCHLVAYAFNEATDELWSKESPRDSRGSRNFDAAAIIDSRHYLGGSVDRYRLGKSLRRKGFDHQRMLTELDAYVARANETLASWVASDAAVRVSGASDLFTAERTWRCEIHPVATMPCGGTHVASLGQLKSISISTEYLVEDKELRLVAASIPRETSSVQAP